MIEGFDASILSEVMQHDRHRLQREWLRLQNDLTRQRENANLLDRFGSWHARVERSHQTAIVRAASVPKLEYDAELPITAHRSQLVDLMKQRQTIIVCGETGSGKSTQLPKFCLEAGLANRGIIGHTQPRRLAARAVAARVAEELGTRVGALVGYKIRFSDQTGENTLVKLMTDGVLLAETQSDRFFDGYTAIIVDEAHERSLNIDFLLGYLTRLRAKRPDLRLIITSATIDPERFSQHFADELGPAPIVEVSGRSYPVEIRYRPIIADEVTQREQSPATNEPMQSGNVPDDEQAILECLVRAVDELVSAGPGDILTFLPTERDIRLAAKHLRGHFTSRNLVDRIELLPLYARLSQTEQNRIFQTHTKRRIVLATNVAESSLTVPGIHYVIDTGLVRLSRYSPRAKIQRLPIEPISQASANQRSGRCGRLGPGVCIRLFSESDYLARSPFTTPEIRRSDLAAVLLQSLMLHLGPLDEFPLLDPPKNDTIRDGQRTLRELGAIDALGHLTDLGRKLGRLPCDPRVGRMLLEAHERNCLADVLIIAAALETQDVRLRPPGQQSAADEVHARFKDMHSDFLSYLRLWDFYEDLRTQLGRSRLSKALAQNFLSPQGFREWSEIVRQLKDLLAAADVKPGKRTVKLGPVAQPSKNRSAIEDQPQSRNRRAANSAHASTKSADSQISVRPEGYERIHQALLSGLLSGVAMAGEKHAYTGAGGITFSLWPGSGLFHRQPKWIVAAEMLETNRRYGRTVAQIDVEWLEKLAGPLLKHSYSDPHWSRKAQSAMVYKRSTLYGLPVVQQQRVALAPIDPQMARNMMIEHGFVQGDWHCQEKFYLHNRELVANMHQMAQRTRRRQWLVDPFRVDQFYRQRLPADVVDITSLRTWVKKNLGRDIERSLWMTESDLIEDDSVPELSEQFPEKLVVGPSQLPLEYRFEPGHVADGITLTIPRVALRQVSDEALGWLVPGLLEEKLLYMIRALPKHLRRGLVPAPDVARKLASELQSVSREIPFAVAACRSLSQVANEAISPKDIDWTKLPDYLKFVVRVIDESGATLATDRDLPKLQQTHGLQSPQVEVSHSKVGELARWSGRKTTTFDVESIPQTISIARSGVLVAAFPALVDIGNAVEWQIMESAEERDRLSRLGWVRLFAIKHERDLRSHVAHMPSLDKVTVALQRLFPADRLRRSLADLIARVAFVDGKPLVQDRLEWDARNLRAAPSISVAVQEIAAWLPKFAQNYHELRLILESAPQLWDEVKQDIERQLKSLFPANFMADVPWPWLREYPRYLQAAKFRWEKLRSGGLPKDRKTREPILRVMQLLTKTVNELPQPTLAQSETLNDVLWLIDELRVSVFAQHLGTRHSVSEKKLLDLLNSLTC